jgi:hypothetical protein
MLRQYRLPYNPYSHTNIILFPSWLQCGNTALHEAARKGRNTTITRLLNWGAKKEAMNNVSYPNPLIST